MKKSLFAIKVLISLALCIMLSACLIRPFKFDVVQGNVVTAEKADQIYVGMSEDQVRYTLGTPIFQDDFHPNRWDYVYYKKPGYKESTRYHLIVYFSDGRVTDIKKEPSVAKP